ncbi:MAG: hypothetical protein ACRCS0_02145 [Albidovulum sp.]
MARAADRLAGRLGIADWSPQHDAGAFAFNVVQAAIALQADAWARTCRTRITATGATSETKSAQGLTFVTAADDRDAIPPPAGLLGRVIPATLKEIAARYSTATARFVQVQLEFPDPAHVSRKQKAP